MKAPSNGMHLVRLGRRIGSLSQGALQRLLSKCAGYRLGAALNYHAQCYCLVVAAAAALALKRRTSLARQRARTEMCCLAWPSSGV